MRRDSYAIARETPGTEGSSTVHKGLFDLVVLRSMAQKLLVTIRTLEQPVNEPLPLSYSLKEQHGRTHRILLFTPSELLFESQLAFVGFVSNRRKFLDPRIIDEIFRVDQQMLDELVHVPGLLSYSSLELRAGNWYNLVVFRDIPARSHFRTLETHRYAAYQLSPAYYEWIRLHNGSLPGGLAHQEMVLRDTKWYVFPEGQQPPVVRELVYET
jgi:hypothetical protein